MFIIKRFLILFMFLIFVQFSYATCTPTSLYSNPGENICSSGYPTNFINYATVDSSSSAAGCGGTKTSTGIGYTNYKVITKPINTALSDSYSLSVFFTGWASGSTGLISVKVSLSKDKTTWLTCGESAPKAFLGNSKKESVNCTNPLGNTNSFYVKFETKTLSPAHIYLRTIDVLGCSNLPVCGNSIVESGEQCDNGASNTDIISGSGSFCTTSCILVTKKVELVFENFLNFESDPITLRQNIINWLSFD